MKTSIMHLISLFLILGFAAACGKKEAGSSSKKNASNSVITGNATGLEAYDTLVAWQAGTADASYVGSHTYYLKKQPSTFQKAMCQKYSVVVDCENPTACFIHTNQGIQKGSVVMNNSTFLGMTVKKYGSCDITTGGFQLYTKSSNQELTDAVLGTGKYLIKSLTNQTGGIFTVYYGAFDGSQVPTSYAIINTTLPSIMNPTEAGSINSFNGYKTPSVKLLELASGL